MCKKIEFNIVKKYTPRVIDEYYNSKYICKSKKEYIKRCQLKLKKSNGYIHLTPNLTQIIDSKKILCSPGGLGGVVYAVPIENEVIHNLGIYILNKELPMFLKHSYIKNNIDGVYIIPNNAEIGYVDYLEFGEYYNYLYKKNNYMVDKKILEKYVNETLKMAKNIVYLTTRKKNIYNIFNFMNNNVVLKVFLFEIILEYLFLFQKNHPNDYMDNEVAKEAIYELSKELKIKFSLSRFNVNFDDFCKFLNKSNLFEKKNMKEFFYNRIQFYLEKYIINNRNNLYGHVLLRNFNIRNELESDFSQLLWEDARKKECSILTYILPKGEVGILPSSQHKLYICEIHNNLCNPKRKLDVRINNELLFKGIMRSPCNTREYCEKSIYNTKLSERNDI